MSRLKIKNNYRIAIKEIDIKNNFDSLFKFNVCYSAISSYFDDNDNYNNKTIIILDTIEFFHKHENNNSINFDFTNILLKIICNRKFDIYIEGKNNDEYNEIRLNKLFEKILHRVISCPGDALLNMDTSSYYDVYNIYTTLSNITSEPPNMFSDYNYVTLYSLFYEHGLKQYISTLKNIVLQIPIKIITHNNLNSYCMFYDNLPNTIDLSIYILSTNDFSIKSINNITENLKHVVQLCKEYPKIKLFNTIENYKIFIHNAIYSHKLFIVFTIIKDLPEIVQYNNQLIIEEMYDIDYNQMTKNGYQFICKKVLPYTPVRQLIDMISVVDPERAKYENVHDFVIKNINFFKTAKSDIDIINYNPNIPLEFPTIIYYLHRIFNLDQTFTIAKHMLGLIPENELIARKIFDQVVKICLTREYVYDNIKKYIDEIRNKCMISFQPILIRNYSFNKCNNFHLLYYDLNY